MSEEHELIARTIREHGDQLGGNLVHLKRFLEAQREAQQAFLAEQREASDRAQGKSVLVAWLAMVATMFAAIATGIQAYVAWHDRAAPVSAKAVSPPLKAPES